MPTTNKTAQAPAGWDQTTYNNFKTANPTLEPDAQDTAIMLGAGRPTAPAYTAPSTLTSSMLQTPAKAFQTTPAAPATQADGMIGYLGALGTQKAGEYQQQADLAAKQKDDTGSQIMSLLNEPGKQQLTDKAYSTNGVDTAQADLKDINNQILAEQVSTQHQIDALLRSNPQGMSTDAINSKINDIKRDSLSRQADLSIIQLSKQGKFDSAKAIADRAVNAMTEQQKNKLDALQFMYTQNKDLFDKADQRAFETSQKTRQDQIDVTKQQYMAKFNQTIQQETLAYQQQLKQQDPEYQLGLQKTQAEIAKIKNELNQGTATITNPAAQPYGGVLNTILASGKFTKDQKASLIAGINSGDDPLTVIKNQAKNIMGQNEATTVTKYEAAQGAMQDLQSQLRQFYAAGGKTNLLSGNYEKVINNLGQVNDPKLVDLATQIQSSLQVYRNAVSGTAYSEQEGKDIASIFPGINKSEGLNNAILKGRMKAFDATIDSTYRTALGSAYDGLKSADKAGVKGGQDSKSFVESTLNSIGASYQEVQSKVPAGKRAVIDNKTGQVGYIDPAEFDPAIYTSL